MSSYHLPSVRSSSLFEGCQITGQALDFSLVPPQLLLIGNIFSSCLLLALKRTLVFKCGMCSATNTWFQILQGMLITKLFQHHRAHHPYWPIVISTVFFSDCLFCVRIGILFMDWYLLNLAEILLSQHIKGCDSDMQQLFANQWGICPCCECDMWCVVVHMGNTAKLEVLMLGDLSSFSQIHVLKDLGHVNSTKRMLIQLVSYFLVP